MVGFHANLLLDQLGGYTYATIDKVQAAGNLNLRISPPLPSVSINDVGQLEGNSGTSRFVFTVSLSLATSKDVIVHFATADGTATTIANADYGGLIGTATRSVL